LGTRRRLGLTTTAVTAAISLTGVARAGDEVPKYRLEPGTELSYKGSSTFRHQSGMHIDDQELTAWTVHRNDDGSVSAVLPRMGR
jgi:hypothetical protein